MFTPPKTNMFAENSGWKTTFLSKWSLFRGTFISLRGVYLGITEFRSIKGQKSRLYVSACQVVWPTWRFFCTSYLKAIYPSSNIHNIPLTPKWISSHLSQTFPLQLFLVGGFNPSEKYDRQNGNLPQIGMKIKHVWNHHLSQIKVKEPFNSLGHWFTSWCCPPIGNTFLKLSRLLVP